MYGMKYGYARFSTDDQTAAIFTAMSQTSLPMCMWIATISRRSSGWTRLRWPEILASVRWSFGESTG
jgi:hypothetical protein